MEKQRFIITNRDLVLSTLKYNLYKVIKLNCVGWDVTAVPTDARSTGCLKPRPRGNYGRV